MYIFGIHQTIYAALASRITEQKYCNRKSENCENITFLPIIYKSATKNLKALSESQKILAEGNSNTFC